MQRRSFLKGAGIVTVAVVGGGVWRAWDQGVFSVGEGPAYEPWEDWRKTGNDAPLALVRAAILAASPHNTQPWLFKITNSSIDAPYPTVRRAADGHCKRLSVWGNGGTSLRAVAKKFGTSLATVQRCVGGRILGNHFKKPLTVSHLPTTGYETALGRTRGR